MQWFSRVDEVGFESGPHSLFPLLVRWMQLVGAPEGGHLPAEEVWPTIRRLFDYLEANAGEYLSVPELAGAAAHPVVEETLLEPDADDAEEDDEALFEAAYSDVIYRDSADDGHLGDTLDDGLGVDDGEFAAINRFFEPRLTFLNTIAQLWQMAAAALLSAGAFAAQQWQLSRLQSRWNSVEMKVSQIKQSQYQIKRFRPWFNDSLPTLRVLRTLTEAFPEEGIVSAKMIEVRDSGRIACSGVARDSQALLQMLDRLRAAKQVRDLKIDQLRGNTPLQFSFNLLWKEGGAHED